MLSVCDHEETLLAPSVEIFQSEGNLKDPNSRLTLGFPAEAGSDRFMEDREINFPFLFRVQSINDIGRIRGTLI